MVCAGFPKGANAGIDNILEAEEALWVGDLERHAKAVAKAVEKQRQASVNRGEDHCVMFGWECFVVWSGD